jgi:hypothetical protein
MTLVSFDDDLDWEFAFDSRLLSFRPVLEGANGEEIQETVRGIAHLAPRMVKNLKRFEKALVSGLIISSHSCFLKPQEHVQSGFDDQV